MNRPLHPSIPGRGNPRSCVRAFLTRVARRRPSRFRLPRPKELRK